MGLWESLELTTTTVQKIANRGRRPRPVPGVYLTVDSHVGTPPLLQSVRGSSLPVHVVVLRRADARLQVRFHDLDKKDLHPTQTQSTANRARWSALVGIGWRKEALLRGCQWSMSSTPLAGVADAAAAARVTGLREHRILS